MIDICCIGHITHDHIITPEHDIHMNGGTSYYVSHGLNALKTGGKELKYKLITRLASNDFNAIKEMTEKGIDVTVIPSKETTYFENIYEQDTNNRKQRVLALSEPFGIEDIKDIEARYIILGSLLASDFALETIKHLHNKGKIVLDAQGFLRKVINHEVISTDWEWKKEALEYIDILKLNEFELETITGEKDFLKALRLLEEWGTKEVLLTLGSHGSIVYYEGMTIEIPAYKPFHIVDATGCGDTYTMGYVFQRALGASRVDAGKFATAVSIIKLEGHGPFNGTYDEAIARIPQ